MIQSIGRAATIAALCFALGLHWAAQAVAWGSMLVAYSQHASLGTAVAQTFDGAHPCDLCKHLSAARHEQKQNKAQPVSPKPDLICATRAITLLPRSVDCRFPALAARALRRSLVPPTPPPRSALS